MAARRKVLFLVNSLAGGGAERVVVTLVRHLAEEDNGLDVELVLLDDEVVAYAPPEGVKVHQLSTGGSLPKGLRAMRQLMKRERPDAVVAFLTRSNIIAAVLGKLLGTPVIISERVNTSAHLATQRVARLLVKRTYRLARHVIAVSQGVADDLIEAFGVQPAKVSVIYNPVDVEGIRAQAQVPVDIDLPKPYLVSIGRLTVTKNPALLVNAFAKAGVDANLVILGEGPEREAVVQRIAIAGLNDRVTLLGFRDNPFPIVAGAAAFVSPSNGEGFPNALVEAMTLGRPVIATNCASGPSEILAQLPRGEVRGTLRTPYGMLVPTDDAEAMAAAIRELFGSPDTAASWGKAAAERAEDFSVSSSVAAYRAAIDAAMGQAA